MKQPSHRVSILMALLVTFLWSTSFILIKWGLAEIPPITYAGLRYGLAALCFLPVILRPAYRSKLSALDQKQWGQLLLLGLIFYTLTQGFQFLGLSLLPAVAVSLMLNFTPIIVAGMGWMMLSERPSSLQWLGGTLFMMGVLLYFLPVSTEGTRLLGIMVMIGGVLANAGATVLGRGINRDRNIHPIVVTFISMSFGAILLLATGLIMDGIPVIGRTNLLYLIWLAVVNTALAFTLWNVALRSLSAFETSIINGTMLIQIAVLAWIFLGEAITLKEGAGMALAAVGAWLAQRKQEITAKTRRAQR